MDLQASRMESRRNLLKKIGAGGALVWTAPMIASASPVQGLSPCAADDWNCGDPIVQCDDPEPPKGGFICVCDIDVEGNPFCWNDAFCDQLPLCGSSAECPPGWRCVTTCCGVNCSPPCGTLPAGPSSGGKASGL